MPDTIKNKIRILHIADVHLDSPFSGLDAEKSEGRRLMLRGTFTSMMLFAKSNNVDLVLIAGDLFDDGYATLETVELLCDEFEKASSCIFVISPGNHDPYTQGSVYAAKKFPKNVHVFDSESLSRLPLAQFNTDVYGWAFTSDTLEESPLAGRVVESKERFNIVCGHLDFDKPISKDCPVLRDDVMKFGAKYNAFGHIHRNPEIKREGNVYYGYSGCLEGRSFDEPGLGGGFLIEAETTGDMNIKIARVPFAQRRYETVKLDLSGERRLSAVEDKISQAIAQGKFDGDTSLRIILTGAVSPDMPPLSHIGDKIKGVFALEIEDRTTPLFDDRALENDMTMRGEFYRALLPRLSSEDKEERAAAAQALKIGLAALAGNSVTQ